MFLGPTSSNSAYLSSCLQDEFAIEMPCVCVGSLLSCNFLNAENRPLGFWFKLSLGGDEGRLMCVEWSAIVMATSMHAGSILYK